MGRHGLFAHRSHRNPLVPTSGWTLSITNGIDLFNAGNNPLQENIRQPFLLLYFSKRKKRAFLCFTPPENEFGNQLFFFWILGSFLTFSNCMSPKKVW